MLPSLITATVVVVLASVDPSSAGWHVPASPTLEQVYGFFRHGPRTPLYEEYPKFVKTCAHEERFNVLRGGLTQYGMNKMYEAGKWLALRYRVFLGGVYKEEDTWVGARGASRAVMTATSMMAGMFQPYPQIFTDLKWQPIPVWGMYEDKSYMFHDFEFKKYDSCPRYKTLAETLVKDLLGKPEPNKPLYKLLRHLTGDESIVSIMSAFRIYDHLHSEHTNGIVIPTWASQLYPTLGDKAIFPTLLNEDMNVWKTSIITYELLDLHIGLMFKNINDRFSTKVTSPEQANKMNIQVTEDTTLYAISRTLGIEVKDLYEPGNGILMELHKENTEYVVRFFHYDIKTNEIVEVEATKCKENPCSLANFQRLFPGLTLTQWDERCKS